MSKVSPYNTSSVEYPPTHRNVYHDHDDCKYGKTILAKDRQPGKANKDRCDECIKLG